jgi:hypothetical protein
MWLRDARYLTKSCPAVYRFSSAPEAMEAKYIPHRCLKHCSDLLTMIIVKASRPYDDVAGFWPPSLSKQLVGNTTVVHSYPSEVGHQSWGLDFHPACGDRKRLGGLIETSLFETANDAERTVLEIRDRLYAGRRVSA